MPVSRPRPAGERPVRGDLRLPRVPEECPQEAVDLMLECLQLDPTARPTISQVLHRLSDAGRSGRDSLQLSRDEIQPVQEPDQP